MAGLDFSSRAVARGRPNFAARATSNAPGVGEDVRRSAGTGLVEGLSHFFAQPGDIRATAESALNAAEGFARRHGLNVPSGPMPQLPNLGDVIAAAGAATADKLGIDPRLGRLAASVMVPAAALSGPTGAQVQGALTKDHPLYQPQTTAGKYARTIAEFAPVAGMPTGGSSIAGELARRGANVVAPAVASETAGQATAGTSYENAARLAAALAGGGVTTAMTAPKPTTRMLSEATAALSDDQLAQAQSLMADAQAKGVPITLAEAVQQVTGGATGLGRMQRVLEGTKVGQSRFGPMMADRPEAVRRAVTSYADTIASPTDQPSMIGAQAQGAATGALGDVRRMINFFAQPNYDALATQEIPPETYEALAQNPSFQEALKTLRGSAELNGPVAHLPDNNVAVVNEVLKNLDAMAGQARENPLNPYGNNTLAGLRDSAGAVARDIASAASPEFKAARDGVAAGRQQYLEPLQAGPLGTISASPEVSAQTNALYPRNPLEGAPAETVAAIQALGTQDPDVAAALTRQHLVNGLNSATRDLQTGPSQWGGAKYAAALAGNPEQEATLLSGVNASGGDADELAQLLEVLRATGKRQFQGSLTAFNTGDLNSLGAMGALGHVIDVAADPPGIFNKLGHAYERYVTNRNANALADVLLAQPDEATAALARARAQAPANLGVLPSLEYLLLSRPGALSGS